MSREGLIEGQIYVGRITVVYVNPNHESFSKNPKKQVVVDVYNSLKSVLKLSEKTGVSLPEEIIDGQINKVLEKRSKERKVEDKLDYPCLLNSLAWIMMLDEECEDILEKHAQRFLKATELLEDHTKDDFIKAIIQKRRKIEMVKKLIGAFTRWTFSDTERSS